MGFGFLGLGYRRPKYVENNQFRLGLQYLGNQSQSDISVQSGRSGASAGIPVALTFDKIIDGGTCPPCTVRDFMNYLIYIERSAENLQFFLWQRDYVKRFAGAKTTDVALAPEWTVEMQEGAFNKLRKEQRSGMKREPDAAAIFKGTDFERKAVQHPLNFDGSNPFSTPPVTPGDDQSQYAGSNVSYQAQAGDAFTAAGIKAPFTIQPFREEVDRVIATYVMDDAPRQLNLSARERKQLLQALSYTTHPTAFRQVARSVESTLRMQAHPNFIRWTICNGNVARQNFAKFLGAFLVVASIAVAVVLTLSSVARGYRAIPAVGLVLGISTEVAALKGMCVVLHGMHHRHVRPWELFVDEEQPEDVAAAERRSVKIRSTGRGYAKASFESFGSSNSYEEEPWLVRYEKRNLVRKIFDREVWIQEPALRAIQDTIFVQAMLIAILSAGALTAVFVCVPGGNLF